MTARFTREAWMSDALCTQTDPEAFFPEKGGSTRAPKAVCKQCDVVAECLAYALRADERYGIWGGKSPQERAKLVDRDRCRDCAADITDKPTGSRFCDPCVRSRRAA